MTENLNYKIPEELQPELDQHTKTGEAFSKKVQQVRDAQLASPGWKLYNCLTQIEKIAALLHVLYRSSNYEDGDIAFDEIINQGCGDYGDSALVSHINDEMTKLYQELKSIHESLSN